MTSGSFDHIDPNLILVDRENRQRRELRDIDELAESIRSIGLINPIVIDEQYNLIAGERRLAACLKIGLLPIPVHYIEDLPEVERQLIELEENVKRSDLPWDDYVRTIDRFHKLKLADNPDWTQRATADALNVSPGPVDKALTIAEHMDNELVSNADRFSVAYNAAKRVKERAGASVKKALVMDMDAAIGITPPADDPTAPHSPDMGEGDVSDPAPTTQIINVDFKKWAMEYAGPKFNLIHCDFPYGVNTGNKSGQSAAKHSGTYEDTPEIYFDLLNFFTTHGDRFIDPSSHLIFWFSMDYYHETKIALESAGWRVNPFPLIWHKSDNAGILPDPNRGPRRTYETALFASLGDRKIVRAVANSYSGATTRELHTSEKPRAVLSHFFRMLTDEYSRVLDPTCGSGNAIKVADELGAAEALGLEIDPEFAEQASRGILQASQGVL